MPREIRNIGASIRARRQNLSRETGQSFELILTRYALERLLHRLSTSAYAERSVLKDAIPLTSWSEAPHRATRDLDLAGFCDPSPDAMVAVFKETLGGGRRRRRRVRFGRTSRQPRSGGNSSTADYGCVRQRRSEVIDYPSVLDLPKPRLRAYVRETVIAEKFQAMIALGHANSRMKDFYDIWLLSRSFLFDDDRLARAIAATFERRGTEIPDALIPGFAEDEQKQRQSNAFLENVVLDPGSLANVIATVSEFIMPHAMSAAELKRGSEPSG